MRQRGSPIVAGTHPQVRAWFAWWENWWDHAGKKGGWARESPAPVGPGEAGTDS